MFRLLTVALLFLAACKDPKIGADTVDAAAPPVATAASAAPAASAPAACASDADCRTFASYCADTPCACQVIPTLAPEPKCGGGTVSCLVNPCARKAAACQNGQCQLVPQSSK